MTILSIDTAANICAVCVWDDVNHRSMATHELDIGRGHAEHLFQVIATTLKQAETGLDQMSKIVVSVGPGSFTGIRIGVSAARGLGLALDIPVVGVSTLQAIAAEAAKKLTMKTDFLVALKGGRGQAFVQAFTGGGEEIATPYTVLVEEGGSANIESQIFAIVGDAASEIDPARAKTDLNLATGSIAAFAKLGETSQLAPKPLYLRAADAKVQEGFALPRKRAGSE